jgi:hypothetical protein
MAMRCSLLLRVALMPVLLAQAVSAGAQTTGAEVGNRWTLSLFRFWTVGGPTGDLRLALRNQGFGDTIRNDGPNTGGLGSGVFGGGGPTPTPAVRRGPQTGWVMATGYRLTEHLDVDLNAHRAVRMAEIFGFNAAAPARLTMHTTIASGGLTAGLRFGGFRVAAGPMYYHTHVHTEESEWHGGRIPAGHTREGAFGALFGAGFVAPVQDRIQFQGRAEFRWVGERGIGPFETVAPSGERVSFSPGRIGFNHGALMLGVAVRP